jgi:imidazoleglycerol-phosphate dehydratase
VPSGRQTVARGRTSVRLDVQGGGEASVATGLPVLDHLVALLAEHASFDLTLEVEPGGADEEVSAAGRALGESFAEVLRGEGLRRHGTAVIPADEALAHVTLEASGRPLVVSNVDLSGARVAGLRQDLADRFLRSLAEGAGLTLHVRLLHGEDTNHVLEAIFKALGVALAQTCRPRRGKE